MKRRKPARAAWALVAIVSLALGYLVVRLSHDQPATSGALSAPSQVDNVPQNGAEPSRKNADAAPASKDVLHRIAEVVEKKAEKKQESPEAAETTKIDPVTASQVVKNNFGYWMVLAKERNYDLPKDFKLPTELNEMFAKAYLAYDKTLKDVDAVRLPLVSELAHQKLDAGNCEEFEVPADSSKTGVGGGKALREARKPTRANQSVSVFGSGNHMKIVRVDESEDPSLPPLYQSINTAREQYVNSVYLFVFPYIKR